MSEYRRKQAWEAGHKAALAGKPEDSCNRQRGTIFYDDWHDGYCAARRDRPKEFAQSQALEPPPSQQGAD